MNQTEKRPGANRPIQVLFVGDFTSASGPANANRQLISGLTKDECAWSRARSKPARILEYLRQIPGAAAVCFTSATYFNRTAIKIAKTLGKNTYYFMHGCGSFEYEQNAKDFDPKTRDTYRAYERAVFAGVNRVYCVSKKLADLMVEREPEYKEKFHVHNIGIDRTDILSAEEKNNPPKPENPSKPVSADPAVPAVPADPVVPADPTEDPPHRILSTGGAIPQKGNRYVCKAIHHLRETENLNIHYTIVGPSADLPDPFNEWSFTEYHPFLPHDQLMARMQDAELYIQNSIFDSFAISVLEGLFSGCSVLVSEGVGTAGALDAILPSDIIQDPTDISEIAEKIKTVLQTPNHKRLMDGISAEQFSPVSISRSFYKKICGEPPLP